MKFCSDAIVPEASDHPIRCSMVWPWKVSSYSHKRWWTLWTMIEHINFFMTRDWTCRTCRTFSAPEEAPPTLRLSRSACRRWRGSSSRGDDPLRPAASRRQQQQRSRASRPLSVAARRCDRHGRSIPLLDGGVRRTEPVMWRWRQRGDARDEGVVRAVVTSHLPSHLARSRASRHRQVADQRTVAALFHSDDSEAYPRFGLRSRHVTPLASTVR